MKIESIIRRKAGTKVQLGDNKYHFAPGEDGGAHVAEVTEPADIARLLSIPEGFREYGEAQAAAAKPKAADDGDDEPTDFLITTDGGELDLGKLSKAELVAFAKANAIKIDARASAKDILNTVFDAVTAE